MSYTYLGLTNDLLNRFNEVELTSSNFTSTTGFYSAAKDYINNSVDYINRKQKQWPWNHNTYDETLVVGQSRYAWQTGTKLIDYDTFRIQADDTFGNDTVRLTPINYDEYVRKYIDAEYNSSTTVRGTPYRVFKTQELKYGVYPPPDNAYTLTYEYYAQPSPLSAATDVPSVPQDFSSVIVDGAAYYAYFFRGDTETADRIKAKYDEDIDRMQRTYIPIEDDIVDTRVYRNLGAGTNVKAI